MTAQQNKQENDNVVLLNHEGQYSLWSSTIPMPKGWDQVYGPANKQSCLDYVNKHWTDMRPKSLIASSEHELAN